MFARLVELSSLPVEERKAFRAQADEPEVRGYLRDLDGLSGLRVPEPASAKKLTGRALLLDAVAAYHERPQKRLLSFHGVTGIPGAAAVTAMGTALVVSLAVGSGLPAWSGSGGTFSEVLSALGLQSAAPAETETPAVTPILPRDLSGIDADFELPLFSPSTDLEEGNGEPWSEPEQRSALPPGQDVDPPSQGGDNPDTAIDPPGQDVDPPGQGGENPGLGGDPPGQGGDNPGQGVDPPGQGGENPGQGVDPPGQSGENPGQGDEMSGQGEGSSGQGSENPGQGSSPPGQGSGSNGNKNESKP